MPTELPRLNLTLPEELMADLQTIAKRQGETMSTIARQFLRQGIEMDEDIYYARLVEERDQAHKKSGEKHLSHDEFWEKAGL